MRVNEDAVFFYVSLSLCLLPTYITDSYVILKEGMFNNSISSQMFSDRDLWSDVLYILFRVLLQRRLGSSKMLEAKESQ